jgi:molybdenum cofactor cytidylyltransferase
MSTASNIGIVILAAGSSSRLGEPKQLLEFDGMTLLSHSIMEAANSNCSIVVVVIGANADFIAKEIDGDIVHIVANKNWDEGRSSSLRLGLKTLREIDRKIDAAIFMTCDQPYISSSVLNDLISTHQQTGKPIVTSNYGEATGPPALFYKSFFFELMELKGDVGARKIIQQHGDQVTTVLFPQGKIDIDTKENYDTLKNSSLGL